MLLPLLILLVGWLLIVTAILASGLGIGWVVHRLVPVIEPGFAALLGAYASFTAARSLLTILLNEPPPTDAGEAEEPRFVIIDALPEPFQRQRRKVRRKRVEE